MARAVQEIMTSDPLTLTATATVVEAARAMRDEAIGDIIVERDGSIAGIVTDRDIVVRCIAEGNDPDEVRVGDICSGDLVTVAPDDDADRAVELMRRRAIRRLPVVDDGRAVGIVSIGDLAVERDEHSALADISEAPPNT